MNISRGLFHLQVAAQLGSIPGGAGGSERESSGFEGFRGLGCRFRAWSIGFRVAGLGCRVWDLGIRV